MIDRFLSKVFASLDKLIERIDNLFTKKKKKK
jgi:hypothetical protein